MGWQGSQVTALKCQARGNGRVAPGHRALLIADAILAKLCIDDFQVSALWQRHEVVTSSIPDQILDASFLPTGMHIGKECLKAIDTVEVHKQVVLSSAMSLQHLQDGCFEVIVDHHARYASPELESVLLTKQKGFLPLRREAFDKHRPAKAEPSSQKRNLHQLAFEPDCRFAKVKLCPLAWGKIEWNKSGFRGLLFLPHIQAHGGFSHRDTQLAQFHPHAMGRPALFWCLAL